MCQLPPSLRALKQDKNIRKTVSPEILTKDEFFSLLGNSQTLVSDKDRIGVALTKDREVIKCFYPRKKISRSNIFPKEMRFSRNAHDLLERGVRAPAVNSIIHCPEISLKAVKYKEIPGNDLRYYLQRGDLACMDNLPSYMSMLHKKGIFFRAIHLGNILRLPNAEYALVDVSDLKCKVGSLGVFKRVRNLVHLIKTGEDLPYFKQIGISNFIRAYLSSAQLNFFQTFMFKFYFDQKLSLNENRHGLRQPL